MKSTKEVFSGQGAWLSPNTLPTMVHGHIYNNMTNIVSSTRGRAEQLWGLSPVNLHQYIVRQVGAVCTTLMFSDCHDDITEILLKVALNSKHHTSKTSLVKICTFNICSNFNVHNIPINIKTTCMTYTIVPKVCHLKKTNPIVYSHVFHAKTTIFSFRLFALTVFDKTFRQVDPSI